MSTPLLFLRWAQGHPSLGKNHKCTPGAHQLGGGYRFLNKTHGKRKLLLRAEHSTFSLKRCGKCCRKMFDWKDLEPKRLCSKPAPTTHELWDLLNILHTVMYNSVPGSVKGLLAQLLEVWSAGCQQPSAPWSSAPTAEPFCPKSTLLRGPKSHD